MTPFASGHPPRPRRCWPPPFGGLPPIRPGSPARCAGHTAAAGVAGSPRHAVQGREPRRRGDGRSSLRSTTGTRPAAIQHSAFSIARACAGTVERPAIIQHSALSIQHCPRNARAVSSARHPFSIQHSALPAQRAGRGKRPTAIQHSALSIQHCPRVARAVASARQPFSIQHSAFSIQHSELPPPPRDHFPPVRVAPEEFARKSPSRRAAATPRPRGAGLVSWLCRA